jgi:hypothetical protein
MVLLGVTSEPPHTHDRVKAIGCVTIALFIIYSCALDAATYMSSSRETDRHNEHISNNTYQVEYAAKLHLPGDQGVYGNRKLFNLIGDPQLLIDPGKLGVLPVRLLGHMVPNQLHPFFIPSCIILESGRCFDCRNAEAAMHLDEKALWYLTVMDDKSCDLYLEKVLDDTQMRVGSSFSRFFVPFSKRIVYPS